MKEKWSIPILKELDIRLTAKAPGVVEQMAHWDEGWQFATYNTTVGDISIPEDCFSS